MHLGAELMHSLLRTRKASPNGGDKVRDSLQAAVAELGPTLSPWLMRGAGSATTTRQIEEARLDIERAPELADTLLTVEAFRFVSQLPEFMRRTYLEGMGFQLGLRTGPYETVDRPLFRSLGALPSEQLAIYLEAAGWGFRMRYREATYRAPGNLLIHERLNAEQHLLFDAGLRGELPRQD